MRYEDWDILLFPKDSKVPVKEFAVTCHVAQDHEFSNVQVICGLPTVCCFVPSMPVNSPFHVSIHSWTAPRLSQYTQTYSRCHSDVYIEARVYIDGLHVGSTCFSWRNSCWPRLIENTLEWSKDGEPQSLKFPVFREEILHQANWNPEDNLGRIKVVLSEVFLRDSPSSPVERVRNLVAFSFQHAPLGVLESASIAWPNPSMWSTVALSSLPAVSHYSPPDPDSHGHSPRRRKAKPAAWNASSNQGAPTQGFTTGRTRDASAHNPFSSGDQCDSRVFMSRHGGSNTYYNWLMNMEAEYKLRRDSSPGLGSKASAETSMEGSTFVPYGKLLPSDSSRAASSGSFLPNTDNVTPSPFGFRDDMLTRLETPESSEAAPCPVWPTHGLFPDSFANTLTMSLLNQPLPIRAECSHGEKLSKAVQHPHSTGRSVSLQNRENSNPAKSPSADPVKFHTLSSLDKKHKRDEDIVSAEERGSPGKMARFDVVEATK